MAFTWTSLSPGPDVISLSRLFARTHADAMNMHHLASDPAGYGNQHDADDGQGERRLHGRGVAASDPDIDDIEDHGDEVGRAE